VTRSTGCGSFRIASIRSSTSFCADGRMSSALFLVNIDMIMRR
jgi:hypothetical protein